MPLRSKIGGFRFAWQGLKVAWREEANFRFHVFAALATLFLSWLLRISLLELGLVVLAIGLVLSAEALNTALEEFCDMVKSEEDPHVGKIKDLAAAAVGIASVTSLVIGCIIFLPHLSALL